MEGNVTFVNKAATLMLGWDSEELTGKSHHGIIHHTRADGTPYPVSECPIHNAYQDGKIHFGSDEVSGTATARVSGGIHQHAHHRRPEVDRRGRGVQRTDRLPPTPAPRRTIVSNLQQGTAILVIDDEESLRNTFQFFLQNQGYNPVITAATYEEALQEIGACTFDLIISDIVPGGSTGIDLLKRVREMGLSCPMVMITGYPTVETAAEAVRLGAFDYIPKPVEKDMLLKIARLALRQHQLEQGQRQAEQERERYRTFLETVFKSVTDGIITVWI